MYSMEIRRMTPEKNTYAPNTSQIFDLPITSSGAVTWSEIRLAQTKLLN